MVQIGPVGTGNIQNKLMVNSALSNISKAVNEAANQSAETAIFDLVKNVGMTMRERIKNFTGGNFLNNLGQNIRR